MKQYFAKCNVFEKRQALDFQENFSCCLSKLPNIPGTTGDFVVETGPAPLQGRVIEFKFDKRSRFSKNIYVEFEQTNDAWFSSKESGIALAIKNGQIVVITCGDLNLIIETATEYQQVIANQTRVVPTRKGSNGNHNGVFSRGYIVPISTLGFLKSFSSCN
jgi:hypothetical protein